MSLFRPARFVPLAVVLAAGCQSIAGLGDFTADDGTVAASASSGQGGAGGKGAGGQTATGTGGATTTSSGSSNGSSANSSGSSNSASSSSGGVCDVGHLVIAEVRTRGPDDGGQDFVELLNASTAPILLDASHRLDARGEGTSTYLTRWTGDGSLTVPPGGRVLLANDLAGNPLGGATPDATYASGIRDGGSLVLYSFDDVVDAVCFTCQEAILAPDNVCEGEPFAREAGCELPGDVSVRRKAGGGVDGCTDTNDNAADLEEGEPSTPQGL